MKTPPDGWDEHERDIPEELARELAAAGPRTGQPPLEALRAAGEGVLPKELDASAHWFLTQHHGTRTLVDTLNETSTLEAETEARIFDRISRETRGAARSTSSLWRIAAAVGAIAILGSAWWATSRQTSPTAPAPSQATGPVAEAPAPVTPVAPPTPTFLVPLERPDVRISLRAMTWRGQGPDNPVLVALKPALEAFRAGNYAVADKEFSVVAARYPDLIEVALYQGVARLFLNDWSGALDRLNRAQALDDPAFADDVAWFLAVARERSGDVPEARRQLQSICSRNAASRACQILDQRR